MNNFAKFLGGLFLSCLLLLPFSSSARAEEETWINHTTANGSTLEIPSSFQYKPIDNLVTNEQKIIGQGFSNPGISRDSLTFFVIYSVPVNPKDIKNFRFKYDFRSAEAVEAFSKPLQRNFVQMYQINSQWSEPVTKKVNDKTVLILKGTVISRQGEPILYHEHYNWSSPTTSETYTITFIYKEKSKSNQNEMKRIISSFQYTPASN